MSRNAGEPDEELQRMSIAAQVRAIWERPAVQAAGRFATLVLIFLFFAIRVDEGRFYSARNLENIARQSAVYATAALGMTFVIVSAGIDLSVGSVIALTVVVVAWVLNLRGSPIAGEVAAQGEYYAVRWPIWYPCLAALAGVAVATLAGLFNGLVHVGLRLVPFITTLGTMGIMRGLAKGIANQKDIYPPDTTWLSTILDPTITNRDRAWMLLPPGLWILLIASLAAIVLLRYTQLGRHLRAIGSNEETARLCGVPVARTKIMVYTLCGFFAGLAGLMQFSFVGIGQPTTAVTYELFAIAAVVIGGGSLRGGEGSIVGRITGALIVSILYMGGKQMNWPEWCQEISIGAIIIVAVAFDEWQRTQLRNNA